MLPNSAVQSEDDAIALLLLLMACWQSQSVPVYPVAVQIADLTSEKRVAENVSEAHISCSEDERDALLFYLLATHPGRTLVFMNSISNIRRIASVLKLLGISAEVRQRASVQHCLVAAVLHVPSSCPKCLWWACVSRYNGCASAVCARRCCMRSSSNVSDSTQSKHLTMRHLTHRSSIPCLT